MPSLIIWSFELGYFFQHIATIFQILKMLKKRNSECISIETNILFMLGAVSRLFWTYDSLLNKFFLTYIEILLALVTLGAVIYLYQKNKVRNYYSNEIKLPIYLQLYVLIPLVVVLSLIFNPGDKFFTDQIFVSLGIFAESIGLLPQLYIIRKSKDSTDLSELYIVFLGIARFFRLLFWVVTYLDGQRYLYLIIADLIHCLALSNFIYNVVKGWSGHGLPTSFAELRGNKNKKMF